MILCTFHYFAVTSCVLPTNRSESTKFDSIQSDSKFGTYEHKLLGTMGSSSKPLDLIFQYARFDFGNFSSQNIYIYPVGLSELFWLFLKEDAIEKRVCNQSVLCAVCCVCGFVFPPDDDDSLIIIIKFYPIELKKSFVSLVCFLLSFLSYLSSVAPICWLSQCVYTVQLNFFFFLSFLWFVLICSHTFLVLCGGWADAFLFLSSFNK